MRSEIIYTCNSINNKNVRMNELEILRKPKDFANKLYFEFGSDENNIKKRFYNDIKTLEKDFNELVIKKEKLEKEPEKKLEEVLAIEGEVIDNENEDNKTKSEIEDKKTLKEGNKEKEIKVEKKNTKKRRIKKELF